MLQILTTAQFASVFSTMVTAIMPGSNKVRVLESVNLDALNKIFVIKLRMGISENAVMGVCATKVSI